MEKVGQRSRISAGRTLDEVLFKFPPANEQKGHKGNSTKWCVRSRLQQPVTRWSTPGWLVVQFNSVSYFTGRFRSPWIVLLLCWLAHLLPSRALPPTVLWCHNHWRWFLQSCCWLCFSSGYYPLTGQLPKLVSNMHLVIMVLFCHSILEYVVFLVCTGLQSFISCVLSHAM